MTPVRFASGRTLWTAVLALCLGGATLAPAQLLEYDGFDYAGAALGGQAGGTGWGANAWQDPDADTPLSNDGVSLAFPVTVSHTVVGSRVVFSVNGEALRQLGTSIPLGTEGSNYFFSALVKRQGNFKFEFRDINGNVRWHFGATNAADAIVGVADNNAANIAVVSNVFPNDETVFVVAKMLTHSTAADQVYLNVYRAGQTVPAAEPLSWQAAASGGSGVILTNLQVRNFSDLPLEVDEIRLARDWASVAGPVASGPPVIATQPASVTVYEGVNAQFTVEANGALPLSYDWRKDGQSLSAPNSAVLLLTNVTLAQAGNYSVVVSNPEGSTNSNPAVLTVLGATNVNYGLQAFWHFDETTGLTAFDATTNHNDGTLFNYVGDDSQWVPSDLNGALAFNRAISNYVDVPHSASIGANLANRFSVAAWFRSSVPLNVNGNTYRLLEKENTFFLLQGNGDANGLGVGGMNLLVKKAAANLGVGIGQALEANRWYHIAGTFDGEAIRIYLDGELKGTRAVAAPVDTTTLPLRIGSDYAAANAGSRFDGRIDEVGIWERALSLFEIKQLAGQSGPPTILEQPQSQTRYAGGSAVLQVRARGEQPLHYLWLKGTNEIRAATSNVLTLVNVQPADAGEYRCRMANDQGELLSDPATLTVTPVTGINDGREAIWSFEDSTGFTAAETSGHGRDGQLVDYLDPDSQWGPGAVGDALSFDGQSNRVVAANSASLNLGSDATFAFWIRPTSYGTLTFAGTYYLNTGRILRKGTHFDLETVDDPGTVRATLRANGIPAPQQNILQLNEWQHFAVVFSGGTVSFYRNGFRIGDPVPGNLGAANTNVVVLGKSDESATLTNLFAGAMDEVGVWARTLSEAEILELAGRDVAGPPVIVAQPQSATRYVGSAVDFFVNATGKRPVTYQWQHDGASILDSNTNKLVLTNLTLADAGQYTVTVQNDLGSQVSAPPAVLTVLEVTNLTVGLVAYWPFDEASGTTASDATGRGHHAAIQNGAASGTVGMIGNSLNFDGTDDFAIVPHAADLNLDGQATISVWINPRTMTFIGDRGRIVRKDINFDFTLYSAGSRFMLYGLNKAEYLAPPNSITTNEWQHLAIVAKDGTIQFFKNGRALADPMPGLLGPGITNDLIIGNFGPNLSIVRLFNGYMDDLGMWDRALTPEEIDGIYQNGLVGKPLNEPFTPFRIREVSFPTPSQVRLLFSSPYTGRQILVQRKGQLEALDWTEQTAVTFTDLGGGLSEAVFDKAAGDTAFYRLAVLAQSAIFSEDFETGVTGWTHGGAEDSWQIGVPVNGPGQAVSGTQVAATSLTGSPAPYSDCYLRSPVINLTGVSRATLTFQQWRDIYPDTTFHGAIVNALDAAGTTVLQQLSLEAGATTGYELRTLPLPPQLLGRSIVLEFRLYTDAQVLPTEEGWYIDDVKLLPE
ncbi:MAG: immunoglobulin domain-containing protein [Verrucomicrobia bacterium]|nr:immunoglobulin domain-containing protein [Verrucomicrobiota bacterium]